MTGLEGIEERRKHKRFKVQDRIYVTIKGNYYKFGKLINISKGGFAFLYITNQEQLNGLFKVDLFSETNLHYLRDMPFKTISDFSHDNEPPFIRGNIRKCGGQFGKLTQSQKSQLDYFIKSYTNK